MRIDPNDFLGKIQFEGIQGKGEAKISLFVISKNDGSEKIYHLKKIELRDLTHEQGAQKLRQWSQENRFVAVIEIGDQLYAHANQNMAKQLEEKGVVFEDKKVIVKTLSNEDYGHLVAVGRAFEEYLMTQSSHKEESEVIETTHTTKSRGISSQLDFFKSRFLNGQADTQVSVTHLMSYLFYESVSNILSRMAETRRELKQQENRDEKLRQIKEKEIEREELRGEVKRQTIKKEEV